MVRTENKNNAYEKFWGQTKSTMVLLEMTYQGNGRNQTL